ncbi:unnamed protein product [Moneuplotes crassus]|uniref:Uncharacterized protein n=1 Tax=Euplotes crassus TaxID=5936 RepID=A0AAD1U623_EUPCR|nr:unnamed protein product [Moneuplotes crassus]
MEGWDRLGIESSKSFSRQFEKDEIVMFSEKVDKINRHNGKQERILVVTSTHLYNFKGKAKQTRKTKITDFKAVVMRKPDEEGKKPSSPSKHASKDIVLHVPSEYDQRYLMPLSAYENFLSVLQLRFANMDSKSTFKVYECPDNLKKYVATLRDRKYGIIKLPEEKYRVREKEIAGTEEIKEEVVEEEKVEVIDEEEDKQTDTATKEESGSRSSYSIGELKVENSRDSIKDLSQDLLNQALEYSHDDLIQRESICIFQSTVQTEAVTLEDFEIIDFLGQGTFGKVYLTKLRSTGSLYAIKSISKEILKEYDQEENTKLEEQILLSCDHTFLLGMDFVFQNEESIYFVMPYVQGGELYRLLKKNKRFPEEIVKFYTIQLILGLEYLHDRNIVHRDLKLENILIDADGYIKIIDFGLAKILKNEEETMTFCGTPEYLAPEIISSKGHHRAVDWWAVGVLIYEMLIGVTPFYNKNRNLMMSKIQFSKIVFPNKKKYKIDYSDQAKDIICKLLEKKKDKRLGTEEDAKEILTHPWFKGIDIEEIRNKKLSAPFKPEVKNKTDTKYFTC